MKNFILNALFHVTRQGYTATKQDARRAYWRDRQQAHRGQYLPPISGHDAATYMILSGIAKRVH